MEQTKTNPAGTELKPSLCFRFFQQVCKHPILTTGMICILCMLMTTGKLNLQKSILAALSLFALGCAAAWTAASQKSAAALKKGIAIAGGSALAAGVFWYRAYSSGSYTLIVMNGGLAVCAAIFFYLLGAGKLSARRIILLLLAGGFIMRLSYVLMMPSTMLQHDVYELGNGNGHSGYIEYLYANGHLPDYDVRNTDQFYHPPLHHIFAAIWMHLQTFFGIEYADAYENVQILSLFYSSVCLILSYRIFCRAGLNKAARIGATAIIAFCPILYIMSGSMNNDILSIAFTLGAILNTMKWYEDRRIRNILPIALCVGLGMMTKLSVWMITPAIAFVFIYVFFSDLKKWIPTLVQYSVFLMVCAPLALFWPVRNFLRWRVPFTYVQRLSDTSHQYVGHLDTTSRLFDFSPFLFKNVAPQFVNTEEHYNDYNPLVGLFKTSVFDEGIRTRKFPLIEGYSHFLFWTAVVLGLIGFCAMIFLFIRKKRSPLIIRIFLGLVYGIILVMYYVFCFSFPHVCTMNIRYGVPLIVIGALSVGFLLGELLRCKKLPVRLCGGALGVLIAAYAFGGYMVYQIVAVTMKI